MPRGAGPKREREYETLTEEFKDEGRYKGREEEVASRIVNKQRAQHGETKGEQEQRHEGKAPDRGLPLDTYAHLTVDQVAAKLDGLSDQQVRQIADYEKRHNNRKTLLAQIERRQKR